ncbi:MAG: hypothetical protein R6U66_06600 [Bacteroidales bacterium]
MNKEDFLTLTEGDKAAELISKGKHLGRRKAGEKTLNLYSMGDFFVEIVFNPKNNHIEGIEVIEDLSNIDEYLDEYISRKS